MCEKRGFYFLQIFANGRKELELRVHGADWCGALLCYLPPLCKRASCFFFKRKSSVTFSCVETLPAEKGQHL
jgi:hypothetical protein